MEYRIVSAVNNNIVLVRDPETGEQIILMSKGIGFGHRKGDVVSDDAENRQVFKFWPRDGVQPLQAAGTDQDKVRALTNDVLALAEKELGIKNPKLYDALLDHIQFAVDRLNFGLPIENPFSHEISLLYPHEYETAREAVRMIRDRLNVEAGEAEAGFIALHLHSAAEDASLDVSIRMAQFYKDVTQLLETEAAGDEPDRQIFIQELLGLLDLIRRGAELRFPFPDWALQVSSGGKALTRRICALVQKDLHLEFSGDALGFLVTDIEKLFQSSLKP